MYTFSNLSPLGCVMRANRLLDLPQFDGPQNIARVLLGNNSPCRLSLFSVSTPTIASEFMTGSLTDCFVKSMSRPYAVPKTTNYFTINRAAYIAIQPQSKLALRRVMILYTLTTKHHRRQGRELINNLINKLPVELHLPSYQYCGPGTKLQKRLDRGDLGINQLDAACKDHDIAYSKNRTNIEARHAADRVLADRAWHRVHSSDAGLGEKVAAYAVANTMKLKTKLGMGTKKRKSCSKAAFGKVVKAASKSIRPDKSAFKVIRSALKGARTAVKKIGGIAKVKVPRILPVAKRVTGSALPLIPIFAGLSAIGALSGGAAGIARAVNDSRSAAKRLAESRRHNETMEAIAIGNHNNNNNKGKGLYLKPHKTGMGIHLKPYAGNGLRKKKIISEIKLPNRALTNLDFLKYAKILEIPNFRGVFVRNALPSSGPHYRETAIVNLDDDSGPGTHWVAYRKRGNDVVYFDSFGDLQPPKELFAYFKLNEIKYNYKSFQTFNSFNCGHLCLQFFCKHLKGI